MRKRQLMRDTIIDFARGCDYYIIGLFCGNYMLLHYSTYSTCCIKATEDILIAEKIDLLFLPIS